MLVFLHSLVDIFLTLSAQLGSLVDAIRHGTVGDLVSGGAFHLIASVAGLALERARLVKLGAFFALSELQVVGGLGASHNLTGQVVPVFRLVGLSGAVLPYSLLFLHLSFFLSFPRV